MKIPCKVSCAHPSNWGNTKKSNMKIKSIISGALIATFAVISLTVNIQAKTSNPSHYAVALSDTGKMKNKMSHDKMAADKMSKDKMSKDKMGSDKMSHDKMSKGKMSKGKMKKDTTGKM
jgi:pentapeptide MXKDX repeat protein